MDRGQEEDKEKAKEGEEKQGKEEGTGKYKKQPKECGPEGVRAIWTQRARGGSFHSHTTMISIAHLHR